MAKTRTISFVIEGQDRLSAALKNAQKNLRGLMTSSIAAKTLSNAQAALKNVEAYKKLSAAILATNAAQIQNRADQSKLLKQRQEAVQQLSDMRKAYAQLQDAYKANRRSMGTEAALVMRDQLKAAAAEIRNHERSIKSLDRAYDSLPGQARRLQEQLAGQQTQLRTLRTQLPTANLSAAEAALRSQIQQTTQALNAEIAALERRNQIHGNFNAANQNLSNAYSNFQGAVDTAQTLMNPFAQAADNAMTFEKSISRLKSLTQMRAIRSGDTANVQREMDSMISTIERLGMTTEYTANQIAGAANFYAISGWKPEQINSVLPSTVDLASIAQIPIDRVADMVSDDMTAFGVKAGEDYKLAGGKVVDGAKYFGDAVAYAVTQSNMDLSTFHEAWKYNAPVARAMGLSLGEAIAQNMTLANAGIKGSMSGTSLRQFWVRLSAPPKAAAKSLEELGFAANDAAAQVAETQLAMQEAGVSMESDWFTKFEALQKYYQAGKAAGRDMTGWVKGLSGQTALSGVMSLFESGKLEEIKRYKEEIDSGFAAGWSADTAKIMRDNTQTSIDYMTSALDALQKAGGDALLPTIHSAAESVTPLIASLAEFTKQHPAIVQGFAAIAAAVSTATVSIAGFSLAMAGVRFAQAGFATAGLVFGDLATKLTTLRTALTGLTVANLGAGLSSATASMSALGTAIATATRAGLAFMFTPIGAAVTALALAAYYAYNNWDKVSNAFSTIGNALTSSISPAVDGLLNSFSRLSSAINLEPLTSSFSALANYLGGVFLGAIVIVVGTIGSLLSGIAVGVLGLIETIAQLGTGLVDAFSKLKDGDLSGAFDALTQSVASAADTYKNSWLDAFAAVQTGLQGTNAAIETMMNPSVANVAATGAQALPGASFDAYQITQPLADASTQAATSLDQVNLPAQATGQSLTMLPPAVDGATAATTNLSTALPAPIDGLNALGPAAANAASALEGAAARISSINIQVPQISYVPMTAPANVAHNAQGGIYRQGSFLTTFAESSPEAAIPIDSSPRSQSLWLQTGQALGMLDSNPQPISLTMNLTVNTSNENVRQQVEDAWSQSIKPSLEEQIRALHHEQRRRSFA